MILACWFARIMCQFPSEVRLHLWNTFVQHRRRSGTRKRTGEDGTSRKRSLSGVRSEVFVMSSTRPSASTLFLVDIVISGRPSGNVSPLPLRLRCP